MEGWFDLTKILFFLYAAFLFIQSGTFMDNVLKKFDGTTDGRAPTTKGILIQGMFLVLIYAVILFADGADVI